MATLKKSARKTASSAKNENLQAQAERLSKSLGESAQQVWLAGVGAFGRAQSEGTKLFETLVKEGLSLEQTTRKLAGGKAQVMRDAVETTVGQARERASDTWDRLEKVFEERVQRALNRLGVPSREVLTDLTGRVETLTGELRKIGGRPAPANRAAAAPKVKTIKVGTIKTKNTPAAKPAKAPATKSPSAKKKKPAARKAARALPKAPRPVAPQS